MKISQREKKGLAAGSVAAVIILVLYFVLPMYDRIQEQKKDIALKERTIEKYEKIIEKQADLQKTIAASTRKQKKIEQSLLKGETTSLAAADIQKIIDTIARDSNINIKSVKVIDSGQNEGLITIPIQVRFESDLSRLKNFIQSIETNRKLLTIPELKIRVKNSRKPAEISVTVKILGFMKQEKA